MEIKYLMQPQQNLGSRLTELFQQSPPAREIRIVSAFMNLTTLLRFKTCLEQLSIQQCDIRITVGIDMGGTSVEVLNELSSWSFVETYIYHNAYPGHTFHPKVILVEYSQQAHLFVGSNNFTEGGFFSNYEASTEIIFDLDHDHENYSQAKAAYRIFFEPTPPLGQRLTQELLRTLSIRNDVLSEVIIRQKRICGTMNNVINLPSSPFGVEKIQRPPRLIPLNQQEPRNTSSQFFTDENFPIHFYLMIPKLQGATIPGEARIPLAALRTYP